MKSSATLNPAQLVPASVSRNISRYLPYLVEVRNRLKMVLILFGVAAFVGFLFYERIIALILNFFKFKGVNVVFTTPFQFFSLALNCGLVIGVAVVIPVVIYHLLSFLKPALRQREYGLLQAILPLSLLLFTGGFVYGVIMMKYLVQIFYNSSIKLNIGNVLDVESFLSSVLLTGLLMGVAFLFPIVMTVLLQLGLVKPQFFSQQRRAAYLIAVIFVMFLPPPDLISDAILISPLLVLFEITLILNRVFTNHPSRR